MAFKPVAKKREQQTMRRISFNSHITQLEKNFAELERERSRDEESGQRFE